MTFGPYAERDLVKVVVVDELAAGEFGDSTRLKTKIDIGTSAIYVGKAALGTATSADAWTIKKITLDASGNPTTIEWTAARGAVWDDRTTESYS